jgi:hypothetical protein
MKTINEISAVTNILAAVVQEIEGSQKTFSKQSAKVSLKKREVSVNSAEVPVQEQSQFRSQSPEQLQRELQLRSRRQVTGFCVINLQSE